MRAGLFLSAIIWGVIAVCLQGCSFRFEVASLYHGRSEIDKVVNARDVSPDRRAEVKTVSERRY